MTAPVESELAKKAISTAVEVAGQGDATAVERRPLVISDPEIEWHPVHLRRIRAQDIAVYEPVGDAELVLDERGRLYALDDPRHEPGTGAVHVNEVQAITAVAALVGLPPKELDLEAELVRSRDGAASIRVRNRTPRAPVFESKFFKMPEEEAPAPPSDRIEASVNASTGRVYRFRREPPPVEAKA